MNKKPKQQYNWNELNVSLLIKQDPKEVNRLYDFTKPYFMWFFNGNEELFHDLIIRLLSRVNLFDPTRSSFHNFIYKMAHNMRLAPITEKGKHKLEIISLNNIVPSIDTDHVPLKAIDFDDYMTEGLQYAEWSIQDKVDLETLIILLPTEDREFLEQYINNRKALTDQRMKYSRVLKKLRQLKASLPPRE